MLRITMEAGDKQYEFVKPNCDASREMMKCMASGYSIKESYQSLSVPLKKTGKIVDRIFKMSPVDTKEVVREEWLEGQRERYGSTARTLLRNRRRRGQTKIANKKLKKMLQFHQSESQNQGLIVRAQDQGGNMLVGKYLDSTLLRQYMKVVCGRDMDEQDRIRADLRFPELKLQDYQLIDLCKSMKLGKATAWDCFPDSVFDLNNTSLSGEQRLNLLREATNKEFWDERAKARHFRSRLLCLNKVAPRIPKVTQFRPIVVTSSMVKFVEGIVQGPLSRYVNSEMAWNQMGFRKGCGIDTCKAEFIEQAEKMKGSFRASGKSNRKKRPRAVFFDVKGAYDHVDRDKLYDILARKAILNEVEMKLLKFLFENVYIEHGDRQMRGHCGVPQGLRTSSLLFNIYVEGQVDELTRRSMFSRFFADDMIVLAQGKVQSRVAITVVSKWLEEMGMTLNRKKSGIMILHETMRGQQERFSIQEICHVSAYKYLGTEIDQTLHCPGSLRNISKSTNVLRHQWAGILRVATFGVAVCLFREKVRPKYAMLARVYFRCNDRTKEKIEAHYRRAARKVLAIPAGTPNQVVENLVGGLRQMLESQVKMSDYKLEAVRTGRLIDHCYIAAVRRAGRTRRWAPNKLRTVLRTCYGGKCLEHQKLMTQSHCSQHNIHIDILTMVTTSDEGEPKDRRRIKREMASIVRKVNNLKVGHN